MDGVGDEGRKGVGLGSGWRIQPLQPESKNANNVMGIILFIFSPLVHCIPLVIMSIDPKGLYDL